jgi:hypothetical protein
VVNEAEPFHIMGKADPGAHGIQHTVTLTLRWDGQEQQIGTGNFTCHAGNTTWATATPMGPFSVPECTLPDNTLGTLEVLLKSPIDEDSFPMSVMQSGTFWIIDS